MWRWRCAKCFFVLQGNADVGMQSDGNVEEGGSTEESGPADDTSDEDRPPHTPKKKEIRTYKPPWTNIPACQIFPDPIIT